MIVIKSTITETPEGFSTDIRCADSMSVDPMSAYAIKFVHNFKDKDSAEDFIQSFRTHISTEYSDVSTTEYFIKLNEEDDSF